MAVRASPWKLALFASTFAVLAVSAATARNLQFFAVLLGGNEVSAGGDANAGDPNGTGTASVIVVSGTQICYSILVDNIDKPTMAHIHEAPAGVNGPIVVPLSEPSTGNPGTSSDCTTVDSDLVNRIRDTPSDFYVNVHTGNFPAGAVRGQLF
jgi:hypothetical protein